jgi:hypothetical protein
LLHQLEDLSFNISSGTGVTVRKERNNRFEWRTPNVE